MRNIGNQRTDEFAYFLRRNSVIDDAVYLLMIQMDDSRMQRNRRNVRNGRLIAGNVEKTVIRRTNCLSIPSCRRWYSIIFHIFVVEKKLNQIQFNVHHNFSVFSKQKFGGPFCRQTVTVIYLPN